VKLLVVSDCEAGLPTLPAGTPELVVCCGDVPRDVLERVIARYGVPCLGVLGNHDPALPAAFMQEVHLKVVEVASVTFGGCGGSWRYKPRGHHLYDDGQVEALLRGFPRVDVFVAHNPPAGVHDAPDDVHNGFAAFRRYIEEEQPALFLHGHVHRSAETMVGRTRVVAVLGARMVES
jgi:Icc-related predicted phosphoesterase